MRLSTNNWYNTQSQTMLDRLSEASRIQNQIATGKRLQRASDDPTAAQRADLLKRSMSEAKQAQRNADALNARLETSGIALGGMTDQLLRLKELALSASNDTLTAEDRVTIGTEVAQIREQLLGLANTRDADGSYVFAGARAGRPAYEKAADGTIHWAGSGDPIEIPVGSTNLVSSGDSGKSFLDLQNEESGSVFDMLDRFTALMQPPAGGSETVEERDARHSGMEQMLADITEVTDSIGNVQASQGARQAGIVKESERLDSLMIELEAARSDLEDVDVTEAVVDLERLNTILKAAQASFGRIAGLSLFNQI